MLQIRWVVFSAALFLAVAAAPRELDSDEIITEPRPGEEYVNIQTGQLQEPQKQQQQRVDLKEKSYTTSHRNPQVSGKSTKDGAEEFETAHKVPKVSVKMSRSFKTSSKHGDLSSAASSHYQVIEDPEDSVQVFTTVVPPVQVVTRTSVKMTKSKKVQKPAVKIDTKSDEGVIDETETADEEEKAVLLKKQSKVEESNERTDSPPSAREEDRETTVAITEATRVTAEGFEATTIPPTTITTTEEPPITTFNYKNIYDKTKKEDKKKKKTEDAKKKQEIEIVQKGEADEKDTLRYQTVGSEALRTAETRIQNGKKDTKQEKKDRNAKKLDAEDEEKGSRKEDVVFDIVSVNRAIKKLRGDHEDNFDFVDAEDKVLVGAGSSPSQTSRINVKPGPNGQDYEYEYIYYYYDEDEDNATASGPKEAKVVPTTTAVYNGHDGPTVTASPEQPSSTSGSRYLPTEKPSRGKPSRIPVEEDEESEEEEVEKRRDRPTSSRGSSRQQYASINRHNEAVSNEVVPAIPVTTKPTTRSRGRLTNIVGAEPVPEAVPGVAEERLPANTRFPPRSRSQQATTPPQPQETTTTSRSRTRDPATQNRVRLPNLGPIDGSSFKPHASDTSIDEDPIADTEIQRRPTSRTTEEPATRREEVHTRRSRPTTPATVSTATYTEPAQEVVSRRPVSRGRPRVPEVVEVVEEDEVVDRIVGNGRRPETTRESDAEEGDFPSTKTPYTSIRRQSTESRTVEAESTTEDQSAIGLTSAMMEKVALDLYAILQQAQNENIKTNLVDANSTEIVTTEQEEAPVTTTTTTTEAPTTTTTTTTTEAPTTTTQAAGRGRYRTRGGPVSGKTRTRLSSSTSTTEASSEVSSTRPRSRFQSSNSNRVSLSGQSYNRRTPKPKVEEPQEDSAVKEEAPKQSFGEKPSSPTATGGRTRYRAGARTTTTTTTAAPQISGAAAIAGGRTSSLDRYNARRRPSVRTSSTPATGSEETASEERGETHSDASLEETLPSSPATPKSPRARLPVGGSPRPLRPGPRINLPGSRSRLPAPSSTTQAPVLDDSEREETAVTVDEETPAVPEAQESTSTTAAPDALTRLKNRPRLRIGANSGAHKPQTAPPPAAGNRKQLLTSLLPKRKPVVEEKASSAAPATAPQEEAEPEEEHVTNDVEVSSAPVAPSSSTAEPEKSGLSGLLAGRRRTLNRRPGTIYSRNQQPTAESVA